MMICKMIAGANGVKGEDAPLIAEDETHNSKDGVYNVFRNKGNEVKPFGGGYMVSGKRGPDPGKGGLLKFEHLR